jgi:DNA primase
MATWVDFDAIKASVSLEQVLLHYNLLDTMTRKGNRVSGLCAFHPDAKTKSFKADLEKNCWNCFGACNRGGDQIDLVCVAERIETGSRNSDRRRAALLLQEWFSITITPSDSPQAKPTASLRSRHRTKIGGADGSPSAADTDHPTKAASSTPAVADEQQAPEVPEPPQNRPLTFTFRHLDPLHPYLSARGLSEETIAFFGLGYHAGKGIMAGRICIPIHNEAGELIAYAGRWPAEEGWPEGEDKYKLPPGFHKSLEVFNLHRAREYASDGLIVTEGFFTVFEFWQCGRKNVVALMGSSLSEAQERLIVQTVGGRGRVLLAFDPDAAGKKGMAEAAARLAPQVFVRTLGLA